MDHAPRLDTAPRRLLVVAYYFPPMGLSGVQRVAKLVKYLPRFGWAPTVLTVEPGGYFAFDTDLLAEVEAAGVRIERTGSVDPTRLFGSTRRVDPPTEPTRRLLAAASQWVFLPDNKIGWYPAAVARGRTLFDEARFDAVLSSAPPYTAHLVAASLAKRYRVPLVADFRDDWLDNPRHTYPTPLHRAIHARMERYVVSRSSLVTTINPIISAGIAARHPEVGSSRFRVVPQGFDPADYPDRAEVDPGLPPTPDRVFRLIYTGVFYDAQTPGPFLEGLARFRASRPEAAIRADFFGIFPRSEIERVERLGLGGIVTVGPYLPHREAMREVTHSDVAWLTVGRREGSEQISTGKLYAYAGARKPILALVPEGAARDALIAYGAAEFADPDRPEDIARGIAILYDAWSGGHPAIPDDRFVAGHDRIVLAGIVANLLNEVTGG